MKVVGGILIVFAILDFFSWILSMSVGALDVAVTQLSGAIMFGVLGAYLVHRGKQKEKEKAEKDEWN